MSQYHEIEGIKYPRVTSILSDYGNPSGLIQWSANCVVEYIRSHFEDIEKGLLKWEDIDLERARTHYKIISGEALGIGSATHNYIEHWIKKQLGQPYSFIGVDPEAETPVMAFYDWVKENNFKPYASEITVCSQANKFAGTMDCLGRVNGKVYVIDFKTSKSHSPSNGVQVAAYRKALVEMIKKGEVDLPIPEGIAVLRLDKITGRPYWKDYSKDYMRFWRVFKNLLEVFYNYRNRSL